MLPIAKDCGRLMKIRRSRSASDRERSRPSDEDHDRPEKSRCRPFDDDHGLFDGDPTFSSRPRVAR